MHHEEEVRLIAYLIWEDEGKPNGCDLDHWLRAEAICREKESARAAPVVEQPMASKARPKAKTSTARRRAPKS